MEKLQKLIFKINIFFYYLRLRETPSTQAFCFFAIFKMAAANVPKNMVVALGQMRIATVIPLTKAISNKGVVDEAGIQAINKSSRNYVRFLEAFFESSSNSASARGTNAQTFKNNVVIACLQVINSADGEGSDLDLSTAEKVLKEAQSLLAQYCWIQEKIDNFQEIQAAKYQFIGSACEHCKNGKCDPRYASAKVVHTNPDSIQAAEARKVARAARQQHRLTAGPPAAPAAPVVAPVAVAPVAPLKKLCNNLAKCENKDKGCKFRHE